MSDIQKKEKTLRRQKRRYKRPENKKNQIIQINFQKQRSKRVPEDKKQKERQHRYYHRKIKFTVIFVFLTRLMFSILMYFFNKLYLFVFIAKSCYLKKKGGKCYGGTFFETAQKKLANFMIINFFSKILTQRFSEQKTGERKTPKKRVKKKEKTKICNMVFVASNLNTSY
ncbi:hypothetical protein RFI_18679 [Reticulomyxa filosa]|uniref:Transmembrane protein n=1 Tax=Reticulomyxa filosa TaxID=46433 RepID=X6MZT6_RETFI|nr:hypothetical protein RFI_18679 [Reticulomyxa filosa]|eukprot:ETO18580.1 hypothetical protein RFI_18679 [Reticulomyxa filosa]